MTLKACEETEDMENNTCDRQKTSINSNPLHVLFSAAMILRIAIKSKSGLSPLWPPLASDLTMENAKSVVPVEIFNFLVWISGFSDDAQLEKHIIFENEQYTQLVSIAEDIMDVSSNGRKLTPKRVSLAMALRQMTGSSSAKPSQ